MDPNAKKEIFEDDDVDLLDDIELEDADDGNEGGEGNDNDAGGNDTVAASNSNDFAARESELQRSLADAEARAASTATELERERQEKLDIQIDRAAQYDTQFTQQIEHLDALIATAQEDGDQKRVRELERKQRELEDKRKQARDAKAHYESEKAKKPERKKPETESQTTQAQQPQEDPQITSWLQRNPWFVEPSTIEDSNKKFYAMQIHKQMLSEGKAAKGYSPQYFTELEQRLSAKMAENNKANRGRSPVSAVNSGDGNRRPESKENTITQKDLRDMQDIGLNPRDKRHRSEYLAQKRRAEKVGYDGEINPIGVV